MQDLYTILGLIGLTGLIFYLGMRYERYLINARDSYINSVNAEANRRLAVRKARRKIKWVNSK